ncbi:endonuclease domain-containing protein [Flaviflagellibacter deserti]|uniref:Endonuclease domain-containing protein n=1 Tax=Flaviflagellibacter deserti TaxID=2267266 RepID=A0ABV9YZJ2_9HYPH
MVDVNRPVSLFGARMARREPTDAERKLWALLSEESMDGLEFRRQVPIGPFTAEFLSHDPMLIIEIAPTHVDRLQDRDRRAYFERLGFEVARYPVAVILAEPERVLADLAARVASAFAASLVD